MARVQGFAAAKCAHFTGVCELFRICGADYATGFFLLSRHFEELYTDVGVFSSVSTA